MKINVTIITHYTSMVARTELVYEEFNCHRTDEHNYSPRERKKEEDGGKAVMRNFMIHSQNIISQEDEQSMQQVLETSEVCTAS
jgi:hypothetical protein